MSYTLDLADVGSRDLALAGGKGANLGELVRSGFPVPPGFIVTTAAYTDVVTRAGLVGASPEVLRERIPSLTLPDDLAAAIGGSYRALGSPPVAVRSSGVAEDLADASFAGQHDTLLDVRGEQAVIAAVLDCWASLWNPHAVAYRERAGHDRPDLALAVVVQTMVDAEWAGVLFTADPVTGRRDQLVIEAVRGLGESLVSGAVAGHQHVLTKGAPPVAVDSPLPAGVLTELADLGTRVEKAFGAPQDIEWTYADGRCALVQARPLTALPTPEPATDQPMNFRQQQVADHLPYPPYPVDAALLLRPAIRAITKYLEMAGLTVSAPEQILVEDENGIRVVAPNARPTRRMLVRVPALLPRILPLLRTRPDDWFAQCARILVPLAEHALADDLSGTSDAELLDRVHAIVRAQVELLPGRFGCAVPRVLAMDPLFKALLGLAAGRADRDQLYVELMAGIATITGDANEELAELATTISRTPALAAVYRDHEPRDVHAELRQVAPGRQLLADVDGYLDRYGYRQMVTPLPGFETLTETPHRVHAMLRGLAGNTTSAPAKRSGTSRARAAERSLRQRRGPRARLFAPLALRLAGQARTGVRFRENSHCLAFMLPSAASRRLLLEIGRRLVDRGALDAATDVVYLEPQELTGLPPTRLRELATRRKKVRAAAMAQDGTSIGTQGSVRGIPASRGMVEGVVRVIRDEDEFGKLAAGDVLVCPYTNPAWTPLFAVASAVVTDGGGAGSHTAIVAREYGIPAVMGTTDATRRLKDGDRVRVDGAGGTVTRLDD